MEFSFIGLCLVISAVLLKKIRLIEANGNISDAAGFNMEFYGIISIGLIFLLIGIFGLAWGIYPIKPDRRGCITLFFVVFALAIQARLINYASINTDGREFLKKKGTNAIEIVCKAFSIGIFPRTGPCVLLIHACQFIQIILLALLVIY